MNGHLYTNSREAFEAARSRGFRIFEVDLGLTRDSQVVLAHDWYTPSRSAYRTAQPTYDEFMAGLIYDSLTPMDLDDLATLAAADSNVRFVLDFKSAMPAVLPRLIRAFQKRAPAALDRLVPQLQHRSQLPLVLAAHHFPVLIFTLYATDAGNAEVQDFVLHEGIPIVVMSEARFDPYFVRSLRHAGIAVYVHTVNTQAQVDLYRQWQVNGVMTDFLAPDSTCTQADAVQSPR